MNYSAQYKYNEKTILLLIPLGKFWLKFKLLIFSKPWFFI